MNHAFSSPTLSKYPDIIQGTSSKYFWPLSFSYCKNTNKVIIDRVQFLDSLGLDATHSVLVCEQNHTSNIIEINEEKIGHGLFDQTSQIPNADGMITHIPNINLVIYTADCMPISFYDPVKKIIGVAHSGWKWTIADISKKMLLLMVSKYWCNITDILVSVGPSIGPCCYEVQNLEQIQLFQEKYGNILEYNNKKYVDLWDSVEQDILSLWIPRKNFENRKICTSCHNHTYASHRADNPNTTANLTAICIKE